MGIHTSTLPEGLRGPGLRANGRAGHLGKRSSAVPKEERAACRQPDFKAQNSARRRRTLLFHSRLTKAAARLRGSLKRPRWRWCKQLYRFVFRRTSTLVLTVVVGAVIFERASTRPRRAIFCRLNEGRLWKDIKHKYEIKQD
ncbi:uncharacterized protein LOC116516714 [Thamnophis elegans]|uniref:uncharacterized protein LOC116516714 n=1 Tax=Thamnophis elegans TaxID=35005 RepID=UPI0013791069|nr:uncharacterized protein LOC116516714 [Thamnophis elegans]